jgi:hypothetical protein
MVLILVLGALTNGMRPPSVRAACCYFAAKDKDINQPGQKAFISWHPHEKTEAFTVQPKFEGNAVDFGMVIPTPARPKLDEMPRDFFKDLAMYTILMPLPQPIYLPDDQRVMYKSAARFGAPMGLARGAMMEDAKRSVTVLESGVVGSLDYKIIIASDASGLFDWLKENQYSYGGDQDTLKFYIDKKWFFTVMKIDPKQMKKTANGSYTGEVTPTSFSFKSDECIYPLKITQISVKDRTDALFYVQAPSEMDLPGDWSWQHSYRPMYLTYMLGCCADPQQQQELQSRNQWLNNIRQKDPSFETTKLEWAKKLGDAELNVLEDPKTNYALMGTGDLPKGAKVVSLDAFLSDAKTQYLKQGSGQNNEFGKQQLARMEDMYQPAKGVIVKNDPDSLGKGFINTHYTWYPARDVPLEDIKGLTRLKGHLQKGEWLTKFRKVVRKDEMTHDLVLAAVPDEKRQTYIRVMPTSPP